MTCRAPGCPESPRGAREFCPAHMAALPEKLREALGWAWVAIFRLPGWTSPPPKAEETARYDAAMLPLFTSRREEGAA